MILTSAGVWWAADGKAIEVLVGQAEQIWQAKVSWVRRK
jgi:hypothetical protein